MDSNKKRDHSEGSSEAPKRGRLSTQEDNENAFLRCLEVDDMIDSYSLPTFELENFCLPQSDNNMMFDTLFSPDPDYPGEEQLLQQAVKLEATTSGCYDNVAVETLNNPATTSDLEFLLEASDAELGISHSCDDYPPIDSYFGEDVPSDGIYASAEELPTDGLFSPAWQSSTSCVTSLNPVLDTDESLFHLLETEEKNDPPLEDDK